MWNLPFRGVMQKAPLWGESPNHWDLAEKKTLHASERQTERVQKLRVEYWHTIGEFNLDDLGKRNQKRYRLNRNNQYIPLRQVFRAYPLLFKYIQLIFGHLYLLRINAFDEMN